MSRPEKSARAITSTRTWQQYGSADSKEEKSACANKPPSRRRPGLTAEMGTGFRRCEKVLAGCENNCRFVAALCDRSSCTVFCARGAETRRHFELHDPGGRATEL